VPEGFLVVNVPMNAPAYEHNNKPVTREAFYAIACDPRRSVAVEACAGAGKTWMLVSRIARALLEGAQPHEILAITFTKKAAGEMRQRLSSWLAEWAQATPGALEQALVQRGIGPEAAPALRGALQKLYQSVLEGGRPVQIRTFHSWFAALLRNAPLQVLEGLGLPANHELLERDDEAVARVWRRFHVRVASMPALRADYEASVAAHGRFNTLKALQAALSKRVEFAMADAAGVVEASVRHFTELHPRLQGLDAPQDAVGGDIARKRWLAWAAALGAESGKTPQKAAAAIVDAFATEDLGERLSLLRGALFVQSEDRLTNHLAKFPAAQEAEAELRPLCAARTQHEAWLHHQRMARLTRLLLDEYAALKREHGWVDMNDVERAALALLGDEALAGFVQERLDAQVKHLLIDEFQDTNPLQWQALFSWLQSYAGAGNAPSVFIVGDPKQSIYRFRRAEPQVFKAAQAFVREELRGDLLACDHTRRNAQPVLDAVNAVMLQAQAAGEYADFRAHTTESREPGRVAALPPIPRPVRDAAQEDEGPPAWRDSLTVPREVPEERLVTLEARQAAAWIARRIAEGHDPGEIMVLARKRDRLAAMELELRALHIPTQQPEKTDLADAAEVQDLVALLDALVSPTHDLSLARALKSPLFGLDDAALVAIAALARTQGDGPPRPWFELLQKEELPAQVPRGLPATLLRWKQWVDRLPPHDALQAIYDDGDVLARFAAAAPAPLRPAVLANLRALPGAALSLQGGRYLTPYGFVRALKAGGIEGPALAVPNVVRLLTVHGAKGLEAGIVLMLDTDAAPPKAETMGVLVDWPGEAPHPRRFAFLASETSPPACCADAVAHERAERQREELNGLYVAMTRAEHALVASSIAPAKAAAVASWWQRLQPHCEPLDAPPALEAAPAGAGDRFSLPIVPARRTSTAQPAIETIASSEAADIGSAMHLLLEHARGGDFTPALLRRAIRDFSLTREQVQRAADAARRILAGEGAWAWDTREVDWQGNEVELVHGGEVLRIDRLVRRKDGDWWVLDYKSAARPERDASLQAQMRRYREAVLAAQPGATVRLAFLTARGEVVELD
jgi:ATP-dependent helicase/nuclease subunit A